MTTTTTNIYGYTVILGLGVGMYLQASFSVAQAVVNPEDIPPAIGFLTLAQFLGITIALAIANAVYLNESTQRVAELAPFLTKEQIELAVQGTSSGILSGLTADVRVAVLDSIASAISKTYVLVIAGGSLVAVSSVAMKRVKLFGGQAAAVAA